MFSRQESKNQSNRAQFSLECAAGSNICALPRFYRSMRALQRPRRAYNQQVGTGTIRLAFASICVPLRRNLNVKLAVAH
jgi:hypothetical protein